MDLRRIAPSSIISSYGEKSVEEVPYITDELVLFLDASDIESYSGTGSTWYDISGNNRDYSIGSGISWNSSGFFTVSGGTFTGPASDSFGFLSTNEHYVEVVSKINSTTGNNFFNWQASPTSGSDTRGIQTHFYYSNGQTYYDVSGCCSSTQRINYSNDSSLTSSVNHFAWRTRTSATPNREMIKNRVSQVNSGSNGTATVNWNRSNPATIGNSWSGNLYSFRVYNRALTDEEANFNYLYDKDKFGF